jgi:hypothetical protein
VGAVTVSSIIVRTDIYAAAAAAKVKPELIRSWLHRGYVARHGHDCRGRALVDLDEVQRYANRPKT